MLAQAWCSSFEALNVIVSGVGEYTGGGGMDRASCPGGVEHVMVKELQTLVHGSPMATVLKVRHGGATGTGDGVTFLASCRLSQGRGLED